VASLPVVRQDEGEIQFKRALEALNVGLIYTGKGEAQAKGKNDLISYYNDCREHQETGEIPSKRWDKAIEDGKGKIRALNDSIDLDWVFSLYYERTVQKDGTVSFLGKQYKVGRYPGQKVTVCLIPDKKIMFYKGMDKICEYHL